MPIQMGTENPVQDAVSAPAVCSHTSPVNVMSSNGAASPPGHTRVARLFSPAVQDGDVRSSTRPISHPRLMPTTHPNPSPRTLSTKTSTTGASSKRPP